MSGTSSTSSSSSGSGRDLLKVKTVGSYVVSVAYSLDDLDRCDGSVFEMPKKLNEVFQLRYGEGYGFIIAAFWNNKGEEIL